MTQKWKCTDFLYLAKSYKWLIVNGEKDPQQVFDQVWGIISQAMHVDD